MADEDFEIDIYGDHAEDGGAGTGDSAGDAQQDQQPQDQQQDQQDQQDQQQPPPSTEEKADTSTVATSPPHGVKRKGGSDERPIDPGASSALLISDLNWWDTDDDIRGWTRQADCEDELKDITFSEHKVNGKSKG